jgi:hypothetical protein
VGSWDYGKPQVTAGWLQQTIFSIALNGSAGNVDSRTQGTLVRFTHVIGFGYFKH